MIAKTIVPLKRVLGLTSSLLLVAGIMIGTGVFKKIAPMAASGLTETQIIAAWVVAGLITVFGALSVSGLAELTSDSGGEYEYLRIIFGDFPAFIFGWASFTIIGSASVAAMSHLFAGAVQSLFPSVFNVSVRSSNFLACFVIVVLTLLNSVGTQISARMNNVLTYLKIAGLTAIIVGAYFLYSGGPTIITHVETKHTGSANVVSVFFAAMLSAFWAYDGWLSVAFMTGEIKNPKQNLPKAIVGGILLVMLLYVLVNLAFMKVMPLSQLGAMKDSEIAAAGVSHTIFGLYGNMLISLLVLISTLGSLNGIIITYSRMYYKMAADGYFFKGAEKVHARFETPHVALLYAMGMSCVLVFSGSFDMLTDMIVFAGFLFYGLLAVGLMMMRKNGKVKAVRIGYPIVPLLFILSSALLLLNTLYTQPLQALSGLGLMLSGVPFFYWFKSRSRKYA